MASLAKRAAASTQVNVGLFGQSLAEYLNHASAQGVFAYELERNGYASVQTYAAWGGSSMLKVNAPVAHPTWYWWDEDANAPGPILVSAVATIQASANKPEVILWLQGEGDAIHSTSTGEYVDAAIKVFAALKTACGGNPPVYIDILERRPEQSPPAYAQTPEDADRWAQNIREAQLELIASGVARFGVDKYDIPLMKDDPLGRWPENYHPPAFGDGILGYRAAQAVLHYLGLPNVPYPTASVARASANSLTVTVTAGSPLIYPENPEYFAIRPSLDAMTASIDDMTESLDASPVWRREDLSFSRSGNVLTITCVHDIPDGAAVLFPYGAMAEFDPSAIVRDKWGTPLRSFAATV